eukprot:CAMPEP_0184981492 /NCGR_PEP_ID=MMETSP1098-20130426/11184_1 /TAXON_ID=89044 /ORGANISM="Spumella elongata, Strain CCAP 955/1" /LENGTH=65 /DNA_ID=CAMNT_0027505055 /DNA_START=36 /DNA_END=233 /DNA_ORIENTATION=+
MQILSGGYLSRLVNATATARGTNIVPKASRAASKVDSLAVALATASAYNADTAAAGQGGPGDGGR